MSRYFLLILLLLAACSSAVQTLPPSDITLTSPAFADGATIPDRHAYSQGSHCSGNNLSPPLAWMGVPEGTQAFALTVLDPDGGNWVHWLLYDIPAETASLPEAVQGAGLPGLNSYGLPGWGGPCPPSGTHHYVFTLYALDAALQLPEGASLQDFQAAVEGHILAQAVLTGLYTAQ